MGVKVKMKSSRERATDPPIIGDLQARELLELMRRFYSDPKNREACEAWAKEIKKEKRA